MKNIYEKMLRRSLEKEQDIKESSLISINKDLDDYIEMNKEHLLTYSYFEYSEMKKKYVNINIIYINGICKINTSNNEPIHKEIYIFYK